MSGDNPTGRRPVRTFMGRYESRGLLGQGGMAKVYRAQDLRLKREVAVKALDDRYANDPQLEERLRREAERAANLNHPNIVSVYDSGEDASSFFVVMELIDGPSLSDVLRNEGVLHPIRAAEIGADVAAALGFAHRNGVVHRDIKPGNIMLASNGHVKVTDFGIAQALAGGPDSQLTQAGTVMGTATYFSPEQAQGLRVDPRSDLYSLGVSLYEMVVGRPPFAGDPVAIAYQHVQTQPVPPRQVQPAVPAELDAIIMKLLAKDPAQRYADAESLRTDLRRFLEGQPVGAMTDPVVAAPPPTAAVAAAVPPPAFEEDEYVEPPRRTGIFIFFLIVMLAAIGGLLWYIAGIVRDDAAGVDQVEIPTCAGQNETILAGNLQNLGLTVETQTEASADVEANQVIRCDPAEATMVDESSTVQLIVSAGPEPVAVPNVVGQMEAEARAALEAAGFVVNVEQRAPAEDQDIPEGQVFEQRPAADEQLTRGESVTIVVAIATDVTVPNVAGQSQSAAGAALQQAGCSVSGTADQASDSVPAGTVIGSNPGGGTTLPAEGCAVQLIVSTGPAPTTTAPPPPTTTSTTAAP